jgi:hypothetical protein
MFALRPLLSLFTSIPRTTAFALAALLVLALAAPVRAEDETPPRLEKFSFQMNERQPQDSRSEETPGFSGLSPRQESDLMRDFPEPARPPVLFDTYEDKWYNRM